MTKRHSQSAFTIIELMVAISLMAIIITAVAMVFGTASNVASMSKAQHKIYQNGRAALDLLWQDLQAMLPVDGGNQEFYIVSNGAHKRGSQDVLHFVGNVVDGTGNLKTAKVKYQLVPNPDRVEGGGRRGRTVRTNRPVFVLRRTLGNANASGFSKLPNGEADVCLYVTSFNLEYLDGAGVFRYDMGRVFPSGASDPIGNMPPLAADANDRAPNLYRIPAIRVTMRVIEDITERQERIISRVIWLPMS